MCSLTACWWAQNYETEHNELSSPVTLVELFLLCVCVSLRQNVKLKTLLCFMFPRLCRATEQDTFRKRYRCVVQIKMRTLFKNVYYSTQEYWVLIARDDLAMKLHQPWHPSIYWLMTTLLCEFLLQMRVSMNITTPAMLLWLVKNLLMTSDYSWMWTSGCWQVLQFYGCFRQRSQFVFLELGFQCFFIF